MATVTRLAYSDTNSSGHTVLTMPSAQPIGTYLVAIVCSSGGGSTLGLTDSKSNVWTQRQYASNATSPSAVVAIYTTADTGTTVALTTSDTLTLTSTAGSGAGDILLIKVTPDTGGTIAYHNGGTGTGSSAAPACSSFASVATDLIISGLCESSTTLNTQTSAGSGYTKLAGIDAHTQNRSVVGQYGTASGASTAPFAVSVTQQYATVAIAITQTNPPPAETLGVVATLSYDSTATKTVNIPITAPVASGQAIIGGVIMDASTANTGMTISDSKGNSGWALADLGVNATPGSAQVFQIYNPGITTGLTTSDHVTVTVTSGTGGTGGSQWAAKLLGFGGVLSFDQAAHNQGSSQNPDSGTTGAAAQNQQIVMATLGGTGTGVTQTTIVPSGFTAETPQVTTTNVRNLWLIWGTVNASGTRNVHSHNSDSASHAWAGVVGAYNSNAIPPDTIQIHLPDALGTGWVDAELVLAVGSGWDS